MDRDYATYWLFSGQGGTYVGAGQRLYETHAGFRAELDRCAEALAKFWPQPLKTVLWQGEHWWRQVDVQPALFCLQYALARLWHSWGVHPRAVLGHSVGEYAAACVAGVFSLEDALQLVTARAELFSRLTRTGGMLAVMADEQLVRPCLREIDPWGKKLDVACINGPHQVVISGDESSIAAANEQLTLTGIQTRALATTHAFHSPLVEPLLDDFARVAEQISYNKPQISYLSSLLGNWCQDQVASAEYWRRHLREAVRFYDATNKLVPSNGLFVEVGVGATLATLVRVAHPDAGLSVLPGLTGQPDEWDSLLDGLAQQYVRGAEINWREVASGQGQLVSLPTYPFQRKRYWFSRQAGPARRRPESFATQQAHPLLGTRLDLGLREIVFETDLDSLTYLRDHRVNGAIVFPAAGYLELALAAGEAEGLKRQQVCDLTIERPLAWQPYESCRVQVVLSPDEDGGFDCRIMHHEGGVWRRQATSRLQPDLQPPPRTAMAQAHGNAVNVSDVYDRCRMAGLDYGPAFQGLRSLVVNEGEAWGVVELPAQLSSHGYLLHPSLLDASFQVMAGLLDEQSQQAWLPTGVKRYRFFPETAARVLRVHVGLLPDQVDGVVRVNMEVAEPSGQVIAQLERLTLQPIRRAVATDLVYRESWVSRIRPFEPTSTAATLSPSQLERALLEKRSGIMQRTGIAALVPLLESLESLAIAWVVETLRTLQFDFHQGATFSAGTAADSLGIAAGHRRLFGRMLSMLAEVGYLRADGGCGEVLQVPPPTNPDELSDRLLHEYPAGRAEVTLLRRCGRQLARVLRGDLDPLLLLFPSDGEVSAANVYRDTVGGQTLNALVAECVGMAVERLSDGRGLRVLEIGAGTGATTEAALGKLPPHRSRYVFSDIASGFLAQAKTRFGAYDHVDYQLLDIERDPAAQDFAPESFDLIIAANVLHATADLRKSLTNLRQLLTPGGGLVLVEGTRPVRWLDLTFGLTPGWWRFQDADLRADYPLLSAEGWRMLLEELGFETPCLIHPYDSSDHKQDPENSVIVSRRTVDIGGALRLPPASPQASWIVLSDRTGVGDIVVDGLASRGDACAVAHAQAALNGDRTSSRTAIAPGGCVPGCGALRPPANRGTSSVSGHSTSPTTRFLPPQQAAVLNETMLEFVQSISDEFGDQVTDGGEALRLWLVTRGGQAANADISQSGLAQSTLWGVLRTIAVEFPHWQCRGIDLDPAVSVDAAAATLCDELFAKTHDDEREIAFRGGQRLVRRLVSGDGCSSISSRAAHAASVLTIASRGTLDGLQWVCRPRRDPGPDEIEVQVHASGLNFRDVLNVLGLYPGSPPLGAECAGRVTRVGRAVSDLRVGDRVLVVAPECLCDVITIPVKAAVKIPDGLSFEQAATLPIAFLTASRALEDVGDIGRGERILIHSAAGGVGLAAVQLAHDAGNEVFATASMAKHEMLRDLGIEHVYDSRKPGFADAILEATNGAGVHLVLNSLADDFLAENLRVLAPSGRYLDIARFQPDTMRRARQLRPDVAYEPIDLAAWLQTHPDVLQPKLERILRRCHKGRLHALPHRCFPRSEAVQAFRRLRSGASSGKILLSPDPEPTEPAIVPTGRKRQLGGLFRDDATYLITGGLGGIGLLTAKWMSETGARHIALLARRQPSPLERQTIDAIVAGDCRVHVRQASVNDGWQLNQALSSLRSSCPPLAGVFHLAGVLEDALLVRQTPEKFANVFAPKVAGAWNLHRATMTDRLDYFVCFSSAASVFGSPGQANHAAANAFLDMLAHYRRRQGLPGLSINWGPWAHVGAAAKRGVEKRGDLGGVGVLTPEEGLEVLRRQLRRDGSKPAQVAAVRLDLQKIPPHFQTLPLLKLLLAQPSDRVASSDGQAQFRAAFRAPRRPNARD